MTAPVRAWPHIASTKSVSSDAASRRSARSDRPEMAASVAARRRQQAKRPALRLSGTGGLNRMRIQALKTGSSSARSQRRRATSSRLAVSAKLRSVAAAVVEPAAGDGGDGAGHHRLAKTHGLVRHRRAAPTHLAHGQAVDVLGGVEAAARIVRVGAVGDQAAAGIGVEGLQLHAEPRLSFLRADPVRRHPDLPPQPLRFDPDGKVDQLDQGLCEHHRRSRRPDTGPTSHKVKSRRRASRGG